MSDFNTKMLEAGIDPGLIDYNRTGFQRLRTFDKPGKRNGAVLVLSQRPLRVWYQNHATGVTGVATEGGSGFICRDEWDQIQAARKAEQRQRQAAQNATAALAERGWYESMPADPNHPYLRRKGVQAHGLHQTDDGYLLVPLRCAGMVWNIQTIAADGDKRFLPGGRKSGCYFTIGPKPSSRILVAEGFATAASLHEALGDPVAVAFDCGNLSRVGEVLRQRYPQAGLIYCADNDGKTAGNPGVTAATKAAAITRGCVAIPEFGLLEGSDWNDYASRYGLEAVRVSFDEVLRHVG